MIMRRLWAVMESSSVIGVAAIAVFDGDRVAVVLTALIAIFAYFAFRLRPIVLEMWTEVLMRRSSHADRN